MVIIGNVSLRCIPRTCDFIEKCEKIVILCFLTRLRKFISVVMFFKQDLKTLLLSCRLGLDLFLCPCHFQWRDGGNIASPLFVCPDPYTYIGLGVAICCLFVSLCPKSTAMVMAGRSVLLTILFPGQA